MRFPASRQVIDNNQLGRESPAGTRVSKRSMWSLGSLLDADRVKNAGPPQAPKYASSSTPDFAISSALPCATIFPPSMT